MCWKDFNIGTGSHTIDGGGGTFNAVTYSNASSGIVVDLSQNAAFQNGFGGTDTLTNIQFVGGSAFDDQITGSFSNDQLWGGAGNDILNGKFGNDQYLGGAGNDTIISRLGNDVFNFFPGDGIDTITDTGGNNDSIFLFGGLLLANVSFSRTGDDLFIKYGASDGVDIRNFFAGSANVIENLYFLSGAIRFDLTSLLHTSVALNLAPVAQADDFTADQNTVIQGNVLNDNGHGTDSDPDGNALFVTADMFHTIHGGTVTINASGAFTYTPVSTYSGADSFTYTLLDGNGGFATGTVTLNLTHVGQSQPPVAQPDSFFDVENQSLTGNVLIDNGHGPDTDPNGLALSVVAQTVQTAAGGTVVFSSSGDFTYTPAHNFFGSDSFSYTLQDTAGNTSTGMVAVSVAGTPTAEPDNFNGVENQQVQGNVLADNGHGADTDPNGLPLVAVPATLTTANGGTVVIDLTGDFTYTPATGFFGVDNFQYTIHDSGTATGTVTINVDGLPVAQADNFQDQENHAVAGNLISDNGHGVDSDPDGDSLSVAAGTYASAHGGTVTVGADGSFNYNPASGFFGSDTFTYTISDGRGGTAVGTAVVDINAAPVAQLDSFNGNFNQGVSGNVLVDNGFGLDVDPDHGNLSVVAATISTTEGGSLVLHADGTFVFTPQLGFAGHDTFTYTLLDGQGGTNTGLVAITVAAPAGADVGSDGNDIINAGNGNGTVIGGAGDDQINAGNGSDVIYGGSGNDTLTGGTGADTLYAVTGNDVLHGASGNDALYAGSGNDLLYGDNGDDLLVVGTGNATLTGGKGADTFQFTNINGYGTVTDFNANQGDKLDLSQMIEVPNVTQQVINNFVHASQQGGNTVISVDADGAANGSNFVAVATLQGVHNFDVSQALHNGSLIV